MRQAEQHWIDTLKLSENERHQLMEALDETADEARFGNLRSDNRVPFEMPSGVVTKVYQPGGSVASYLIHPRNLSRTGMSFLHGAYVHDKSRCEVFLRTVKNQTAVIAAVVKWCRHVRGRIHEVGVHFNHPIVMSAFVKSLPASQTDTQRLALAPFNHRLLYVEDCVDDLELLTFHFKNAGVEILKATEALAALEMSEAQPLEAVVTSAQLPGMNGIELVEMLRANGFTKPIIVLSVDGTAETEKAALARGATLVIKKPYAFDDLAGWLGEHLPATAAASTKALLSNHWSNMQMRPLILSFLARLEKQAQQLGSLIQGTENRIILEKMCLDLRGSAGGYGFPGISDVASKLYEDVRTSASIDALKARAAELTRLCESACEARQTAGPA